MPFLSKSYHYSYDNTTAPTAITYQRRRSDESPYTMSSYHYERKSLSNSFFSHIKEILQRTNLDSIVFDDEKENTVTIFGVDLKITCNFRDSSASENQYVRPVVYCPLLGTNQEYATLGDPSSYVSTGARCNKEFSICVYGDATTSKQIMYTLKLYYNTNFVICHYESHLGYEVPLFCIIQGDVINSDKKVVYIGECVNYWSIQSSMRTYHRLVIPANEENSDIYTYYPSYNNTRLYDSTGLGNSNFWTTGNQWHLVFDATKYPKVDYLTKLYNSEEHVKNVYMKKLTSWNGLIQYDNVYDASVLTDTLVYQNLSKISYATLYTINGTQYYCPGSTLPKMNDASINAESYNNSRRPIYLFKL